MSPLSTRSILLLSVIIVGANESLCPSKCVCRRVNQRDEIKLRCGDGQNKVSSLEELDLMNIANDVVQFNLSDNLLDTFYPKVQLIALQKLDLSGNRLTELQNNQFSELPNLRRLDVSNNNVRTIELLAFAKLGSLEKLKLNQNQISTIALGTFNPLGSLKQLDISNNPLTCDCSLLWLLSWSQKQSVKLVSSPTCATPPSFKGLLLRKLKVGVDIHCKSPALSNGFPPIEMEPRADQVVFEGDALTLRCSAPSISDSPTRSRLLWRWLDADARTRFADVAVEDGHLQSTGLVASSLRIPRLTRNHSGVWSCLLAAPDAANRSRGITVVVISDATLYCPAATTSDSKGTYAWPRTVADYAATAPCEAVDPGYDVATQRASRFCGGEGRWAAADTTACSYTSVTTKILDQFSRVNASVAAESAKHFRNYTATTAHFRDVMDVVFAVETMRNYLKYLSAGQIGGVLMDVVNNLMRLPRGYLREAQRANRSCEKLVNLTEGLAGVSSTALPHKSNIAIGTFPVKKHSFTNLRCTWYVESAKRTEHLFYCVADSENDITDLPGKSIEASITIPETLFDQLEDQEHVLPDEPYNILVAMYSSSKFFPIDSARQDKEDVISAVAGVKLVESSVTNLTDPVFVMLRTPDVPELGLPTPVWWDPKLNDGTGSWTSEGCEFSHEHEASVVFYCHNFGYYGLLYDVTTLRRTFTGAKFKLSHPAVYVGSFILFVSLLVVILTYLLCYHSIQMPKKAKHSLINQWLAVCLLCFFYVFGIYQTEDLRVCQTVGMLLHYFTLSSVLWMCVGVNCMYKRLSKSDVLELQDDELPSDPPVKKPILGLYFVGWGVAVIVCGLSAAINIRDYASPGYCFLRPGPPLSALYVPAAILSLFLGIFCLLVRCAISGIDAAGHLSEGTQATENVDLDLLEPNFPETRSVLSASSKTASSEADDQEHSPSAQLKAYVIFLALYALSWLSCACATVAPLFAYDAFSAAYAVCAAALGAFTVFFYGVARSDVRGRWSALARCARRKCFRSRNVSDVQVRPLGNPTASEAQVTSRSSSRSSGRTKSRGSNALRSAADLNAPSYAESQGKVNNVNLVVLHRQQYRTGAVPNVIENPTNAAEAFYNPHQSIVARKFFKRQKRHMMKRNNLVPRQRDSDTASVLSELRRAKDDSGMFGTSSKVNNTNIHVERAQKRHRKNPNLFSDSADEYDCVDVTNIVLSAGRRENAKQRKQRRCDVGHKSPENAMRSVSQQCTLEYSSENVSDSILDRTSPVKECVESAQGSGPRIFVNPAHDLHKAAQSRASSVNDLDDLYEQIRRGPKQAANGFSLTRNSPCFSDSDVRPTRDGDDDVETTV